MVHLYSLADSKITPVTTSMTNSYAPVFDPDGKYLYFLSDRDFNEVLGNIDFEFANPKTTRVYMVTLRKDETVAVSAAERRSRDQEGRTAAPRRRQQGKQSKGRRTGSQASRTRTRTRTKRKTREAKDKEKEKPKEFRIDLDGIQDRIVALPIEPARHSHASWRPRASSTTRRRRFKAFPDRSPAKRPRSTFTT